MKVIYSLLIVAILVDNPALAMNKKEAVKQFINAFNQRDIEQMLTLSAMDIKWFSVSGKNISTEAASQTELKSALTDYFESTPSAKSEIVTLNQSGHFVYSLEKAFWSSKGKRKSQCSMAVYEFVQEKIQHVWYFPAHSC